MGIPRTELMTTWQRGLETILMSKSQESFL